MFEPSILSVSEWLADVPEPDWAEHPVYSTMVPAAERLARLAELAPAARPTGELARLDPRELSAGERVEVLALLQEQQNWIESVQLRLLAEIDRTDASRLRLSQEAVSLALTVPVRTAQTKLKTGRTLVADLPQTLASLARGEISARHAEVITEASWRLAPDVLAGFEDTVLERAAEQTVPQLRQSVRRAALALDPATAQQRQQRALADRRVGFEPGEDGMVQLPVLLGAPQGQLIFTRLTAAAKLLPAQDIRTMDQKRADLLVDAVLSGLPSDALPELRGHRPSIQVIVGADTLLGLDDEPAHLAGYGAITAETARQLAADESGSWRRLLTDPDTGQLLDISERHYRPSQRLRDFVAARDGVCTFPTCNQPGYRCEYEHIVPHLRGGQTCRCNGALACKRHNLCKIDTGWEYRYHGDGSFTWTDDTGHQYRSHPPVRWGSSKPPPAAPEQQPTVEAVQAGEDADYRRLHGRLTDELDRAAAAGDQPRISHARHAILAAERQRARQLAHRVDPTEPPF